MNLKGFQRVPDIRGGTDEETLLLREQAREARAYIEGFKWCPGIRAIYLAHSIPGVFSLFLFGFTKKIGSTDDQLWVVVGDLPSAYLVVVPPDSPSSAMDRYCTLMEDWVAGVRNDGDLSEVFPVRAEPTAENASMLSERIRFLRDEVIAQM